MRNAYSPLRDAIRFRGVLRNTIRPDIPILPRRSLLPFFWDIQQPQLSLNGPDPEWSYAGALPDGQGGTDSSGDPVVHDEGVWCGPGYTNELPSGAEDFTDTGIWTRINAIDVDEVSFAPFYLVSRSDTVNNQYLTRSAISLTLGEAITASIYVKANTLGNLFGFRIQSTFPNLIDCVIDLTNGSIAYSNSTSWTGLNIHVKDIGDNWYLVSLTGISDETKASGQIVLGPTDIAAANWITATSVLADCIIANPQIVNSPYLFPYIPPATSVVSAAATTGGNGINVPMDTRMLEQFRGEPDGVELAGPGADTVPTGIIDNGDGTYTADGTQTSAIVIWAAGLSIGDRFSLSFTIHDISSGSVGSLDSGNISISAQTSVGTYSLDEAELTSGVGNINCNVSDDFVGTFSVTWQKLNPATITLAAIVTMGVGSDELALSQRELLLSQNDAGRSSIYLERFPGGDSKIIQSFDGTTAISLTANNEPWSRNERHIKVVQMNITGTQFRAGNLRIGIDSSIQWSSWAAFDGSFDPLTYLRYMLNNTVPMWMRQVQLWSAGEVAEAEILKLAERYGHA